MLLEPLGQLTVYKGKDICYHRIAHIFDFFATFPCIFLSAPPVKSLVVVVVVDFLLLAFLCLWNLEQGTISVSWNIKLGGHLEAVTIIAPPVSFLNRGLHLDYE